IADVRQCDQWAVHADVPSQSLHDRSQLLGRHSLLAAYRIDAPPGIALPMLSVEKGSSLLARVSLRDQKLNLVT
ncbi:TPA: hypothetical protein ACG1S6_006299, partial [Pseudomonas aeruginosa]